MHACAHRTISDAVLSAFVTKRNNGSGPVVIRTLGAVLGLCLVASASPARADDVALARTVAGSPVARTTALRAGVALTETGKGATVDLREVLVDAQPTEPAPEVRLDGALFAGLATAGLVIAAQPGEEGLTPRPTAGLSPRLLRGGGVLCDVRLAF